MYLKYWNCIFFSFCFIFKRFFFCFQFPNIIKTRVICFQTDWNLYEKILLNLNYNQIKLHCQYQTCLLKFQRFQYNKNFNFPMFKKSNINIIYIKNNGPNPLTSTMRKNSKTYPLIFKKSNIKAYCNYIIYIKNNGPNPFTSIMRKNSKPYPFLFYSFTCAIVISKWKWSAIPRHKTILFLTHSMRNGVIKVWVC